MRWLLLAAVLGISACGDGAKSPADQLRADIDAIQRAAENRDIGEFMAFFSEEYDDEGGRGWKDVRALAQFQFLRNPQLHTFKVIQRLDMINDQRASVSILAALAGSPIEGASALSGMRAELMQFELEFEFDEQWKIRKARWARAGVDSFLGGG